MLLSCSSVAAGWHAGEDYRDRIRQDVRNLCELLPKATIIHGDATDQELLIEEGIAECQMPLLP